MKKSHIEKWIRSMYPSLATVVLVFSASQSVTEEYFSASETIREAGVGTYSEDYRSGESDDEGEADQTSDKESYGTEWLYINGERCFVMRSASGTIVTCD